MVTVNRYLVEEGQSVSSGQAIVELENWWARFNLVVNANASVAKNLFDSRPEARVPVGTPLSFLFVEPEDLPKESPLFSLVHVSDIRKKP